MDRVFFNRTYSNIFFLILLTAYPSISASEEAYVFDRMWPLMAQQWYFSNPHGIDVDSNKNVYVVDSWNYQIKKFNQDGILINIWGSEGSEDGQFTEHPEFLTIDSGGNIYVVESRNHRIHRFTTDGIFISNWGSEGIEDGRLNYPNGIATDAYGIVYVVDTGNHRIQKFTSEGIFISKWGSEGTNDGHFSVPKGIAIGDNGNVYVTDMGNNNVQIFTLNGSFINKFGGEGSEDGQFINPQGVDLDKNGNVYISDINTNRIQKFTPDGEFISKWGSSGFQNGDLDSPLDIAIDLIGNIYVTDYHRNQVQKFTTDGIFVNKWGSSDFRDGHFSKPTQIVMNREGNLFITDTRNHRVQKFSQDGIFITKWGNWGSEEGQFDCPMGIAIDSNENILVVDSKNNRIQKFNSDGIFLTEWGNEGSGDGEFLDPMGIALDSYENVYVTDHGNFRIQKFNKKGVFLTKWGSQGSESGQFAFPTGIAVDDNDIVYVADNGWNWELYESWHEWIQIFSDDGNFIDKWFLFRVPNDLQDGFNGLTIDQNGDIFLANRPNHCIQKFSRDNPYHPNPQTFSGNIGVYPGSLYEPSSLCLNSQGKLFVVDSKNNRIQILKPLSFLRKPKAIVIAGGGPYPGNNLWDVTQMCANFAYRTLIYRGLTKDTICYLSSDLDQDLDNNGVLDDVDGEVTFNELINGVDELKITAVSDKSNADTLIVYLVDHGGDGKFRMSGEETLSVDELDFLLDIEQDITSCKIIVVYDACESGSFLPNLTPPIDRERVVITSTSPKEPAHFISMGSISFSEFFWTHVFNGVNVKDAFELASASMSSYQTAMIDANGNGVGNEKEDKELAAKLYIGSRDVIQGSGPQITEVSSEQIIDNSSSVNLYASGVTDDDGISRVWAVIRPPDYNQTYSGNPVQELPSIDFINMGNDHYEVTYDGFNTEGTYHISIYARDRIGNTSVPKLTTVSVNNPLNRRAIIVAGGDGSDPLWPSIENIARLVYDALKFQGYTDDNIYFMSPITFTTGVDVAPSLSNISFAVQTWAAQNTKDLAICLIGKGDNSTFQISATETLLSSDLNNWINNLQDDISGAVSIIYDACMSGSFITALAPPAGKSRILVSSTSSNEAAMFISDGEISFSKFFWKKVLNGASILDAFIHASNAISISRRNQTPQLDDSGNGIGNEMGKDGRIARGYKIGTGIMLAGDDPIIGSVSPETAMHQETSALIWAQNVTTTGDIDRVWAVISPPDSVTDSAEPVTDLIELDLSYNASTQRYEATYNDFESYGQYWVSFYAIDADSNISMPMQTLFYKENAPVTGDLYPDGNVNLIDAVISLKSLTGMDVSGMIRHNYTESGVDVNGDDMVGLEEAIYILTEIGRL